MPGSFSRTLLPLPPEEPGGEELVQRFRVASPHFSLPVRSAPEGPQCQCAALTREASPAFAASANDFPKS